MHHINIEDKIEIITDRISAIENYTNEINQELAMGLIAEDQIESINGILSNNQIVLIKLNELLTNLNKML
jgi:hypothetical protein